MKAITALAAAGFLVCASAFGQVTPPAVVAACGPDGVDFKVHLDQGSGTVTAPEPGMAKIYFIHESGNPVQFAYPTTRVGVDGRWVGANHGDSYFSISVDPGEHHVCVNLQSSIVNDRIELVHLNARAGETYFYRTRLVLSRSVELLVLEPLDSDQGSYMVSTIKHSSAKARK